MEQSTVAPRTAVRPISVKFARRLYDLLNERDLEAFTRLHTSDFVDHHAGRRGGFRDTRAALERLFQLFPDVTVTVDHIIAQHDRVLVYTTWRGTHTETGKRARFFVADLYRFDGGQVAEHWDVVDYSGLTPFGVPPDCQEQPASRPDLPAAPEEEANSRLVLRVWDELYNQHLMANADRYFRADYIQHNLLAAAAGSGIEGFRQFFLMLFQAFPDMTADVSHIVAEGDLVGVFSRWRGRRPETGEELDLFTSDLLRVQDGLIAEHWDVFDFSAVAKFGVAPPLDES